MTPDHGSDRVSGNFAELLRRYRLAAGLTQIELAERAAVGVRTVRDLERGRSSRPQRTTVELLATALDLDGPGRTEFLAAARRPAGPVVALAPFTDPGRVSAGDTRPAGRSRPGTGLGLPEPAELTGRDHDVAELTAMLTPGPRLARGVVSLVGLAGVGKTALALKIARRMRDRHPGGTNGIVLTEGSTESDVLSVVAAVFGVGRASDLAGRLPEAPSLLLVDAVERAPGAAAGALDRLAAIAPSLRILATGRHPVGLPGERVWPVTPLEVPAAAVPADLDAVAGYPAVELFLARLRQVRREPPRPDEVAALVELVRRLGGLPLAIELAAAHGRLLDLNEILDRYGNRVLDLATPPVTRAALGVSLRDAVAASFRLLGPTEQAALRRLSVLRNRWSVELAERMLTGWPAVGEGVESSAGNGLESSDRTGAELVDGDPVPLLDRLMALGLISSRGTGPLRFRLLDVVRDFAMEHAVATGELAAIRRRHASVLADLAVRVAADLTGGRFLEAVGVFDEITADLWAALAHSANDDPHTALRLAAQLSRWWRYRGRDVAGRQWLRRLLDDPRTADADPTIRAWAEVGIAQLAQEHGAGPAEMPAAEHALAEFERLGDVVGELAARSVLCGLWTALGGHDAARRHGEAALALATRSGRVRDMAVAQNNLTWHEIRRGDLVAARRRLAAVDRLAGQCGEERLRVLARANLAEVARLEGRYADAVRQGRRAVQALADLGDPGHRRRALGTVGLALAEDGRIDEAGAVLAELRARKDPDGGPGTPELIVGRPAEEPTPPDEGICALIEAVLAVQRGDREWAAEWYAAAAQSSAGARDLRDVAEALVGVVATTDDPAARANARKLLDQVCLEGGITLLPRERAMLDSVD
ncbi:helix-turn-helix domain-containing protein [Plantactinospora sp. B5E13]|uniref:ATP-binding protein n=1 Tax=unclassified Plantactinospora TaxID=2631981 RepID=UPI00325EE8CA